MILNTDDVSKGNSDLSGCGGVLRNGRGCCLEGFMVRLELCNAPQIELTGILKGLQLAWDLGF